MSGDIASALVVWGGWPGHEPEQGAEVTSQLLTQQGFAVRVTNDLQALGEEGIRRLSLVVVIVTNAHIDRAVVANLAAAVRSGVGLAGYHGGLAASFRDQVDFHFMTGCQWVAHPGGIVRFTVNVVRRDDPVMAGIDDFDCVSEQYYLHFDPSIELLATTTFDGSHDSVTRGVVMPVVYKRRFGEGRVFYSALGHSPRELERHETRTILARGLAWAAGQ